MKISETLKFKEIMLYLKNPVIVFGALCAILFIFLSLKLHMLVPDLYANREAAWQYAQTLDTHADLKIISAKYGNILYKIYNPIFKIFALSLSALIFVLIFKVKKWQDFFENKLFTNTKFIFWWINLSYIAYGAFETAAYLINEANFVRHRYADSMSIPLFIEIFTYIFMSVAYFPIANMYFLAIYKTQIKSRLYMFLSFSGIVIIMWLMLFITFRRKFSYFDIGLNLIYLIWIAIFYGTIKTLNNKRKKDKI